MTASCCQADTAPWALFAEEAAAEFDFDGEDRNVPLQRAGRQVSPKMVTYPKNLVDALHPTVLDDHLVVSAQSQLRTC
jgi:hypothetical protein